MTPPVPPEVLAGGDGDPGVGVVGLRSSSRDRCRAAPVESHTGSRRADDVTLTSSRSDSSQLTGAETRRELTRRGGSTSPTDGGKCAPVRHRRATSGCNKQHSGGCHGNRLKKGCCISDSAAMFNSSLPVCGNEFRFTVRRCPKTAGTGTGNGVGFNDDMRRSRIGGGSGWAAHAP